MFVTVTPNPALDRFALVPEFRPGVRHDVKAIVPQPGGKGVNVARGLKAFGMPVVATGFVAGETGKVIRSGLERLGVPTEFVFVQGESRTCVTILDPARVTCTTLHEEGPEVTQQDATRLNSVLGRLGAKAEDMVFSGSLTPGLPPDTYRRWIEAHQRGGGRAILDASGPALYHGLEARPFLVKPNQAEAEELLGYPLDGENRLVQALETLRSRAQVGIITLGPRGAVVAAEGERWRVLPPPVAAPLDRTGSGDAFLAGFLVGLRRGLPIRGASILAAAAGAAQAQLQGAGHIRLEALERLAGMVRVEQLGR